MFSYITLLAVISVSLPHVAPQEPGSVGTCSALEVTQFVSALPDAVNCGLGLQRIFTPGTFGLTAGSEDLENVVNAVCAEDCGNAFSIYALESCGDVVTGVTTFLYCLPTAVEERGRDRCRYNFPDLIETSLIDNLQACSTFEGGACPKGCSQALSAFVDQVGCCYRSLYNDTTVLYGYRFTNLTSETQDNLLRNANNLALWSACGVDVPDFCVGDAYPGNRTLVVGSCEQEQIDNFIIDPENEIPERCGVGLTTIYGGLLPPSRTDHENALDDICTEDCTGTLNEFYTTECFAPLSAVASSAVCYRNDADVRCGITTRDDVSVSILTNVGVSCANFDPDGTAPCPDACKSDLETLSDTLGCCYQTIYNNTMLLDLFTFQEDITIAERFFIGAVSYQPLWDRCEVAIPNECTGDPLSGAIRFAASAVIVMLVSIFVTLM